MCTHIFLWRNNKSHLNMSIYNRCSYAWHWALTFAMLLSSEVNWSGATLFAKAGHIQVQQDPKSRARIRNGLVFVYKCNWLQSNAMCLWHDSSVNEAALSKSEHSIHGLAEMFSNHSLMLSMLVKNFNRWHFEIFFLFLPGDRLLH